MAIQRQEGKGETALASGKVPFVDDPGSALEGYPTGEINPR